MTFIPEIQPAYIPGEAGQLQRDALARGVREALVPNLLFRAGMHREPFPATVGSSYIQPVKGLMDIVTTPSTPGVPPKPTPPPPLEFYRVTPKPYRSVTQMSMPLNYGSAVGPYWQMKHGQVIQSAMSVNRIIRNAVFSCYQYGHAIVDAVSGGGVTVRVSSLNGFASAIDPTTGYPVPASSAAPRTVLRNGSVLTQKVIGATPDEPLEPNGPGTLTFSAATAIVAGDVLTCNDASKIIRPNGATSVDGIGINDRFSLDLVNRAVTVLRNSKVQPMPSGYYHVHLLPESTLGLAGENQVQRQIETRGIEDDPYRTLAFARMSGCEFFNNVECPNTVTTTASRVFEGRPSQAPLARTSGEIGAELINKHGTPIARAIVLGAEAVSESYVDEGKYITEAGVLGKVEARAVVNNGIEINADGIRFIDQSPTDIFGETINTGWSITADWVCQTNRLTSYYGQSYARAVVIECAATQL